MEISCRVNMLHITQGMGQYINFWLSSVQLLSRVRLFVTPWIAARQASLSITIPWSSLKLTSFWCKKCLLECIEIKYTYIIVTPLWKLGIYQELSCKANRLSSISSWATDISLLPFNVYRCLVRFSDPENLGTPFSGNRAELRESNCWCLTSKLIT